VDNSTMPEIVSRHFGVISFPEDAILLFQQGLPAFEQAKRFVLIERPAASPLVFLQSLDDPSLCFLAVSVLSVDCEYELGMSLEDLRLLDLDESRQPEIGREVACFAIVSAPQNRPATANLLAPVVVNLRTRVAIQAIRTDTSYSHQYALQRRQEAQECS